MRSGPVAVMLAALLAAGCSSSGAAGDLSASESASTALDTIDTTTTDTTGGPSTSDAFVASSSSTSVLEVDNGAATAALIADIEADLNAGEQALLAGAGDPGSPASRVNLERYFSGRALQQLIAFYDALVADGLTARANPAIPSKLEVIALVEQVSDESVIADVCRIDAGVIVDTLVDGSEAIVNDEVVRYEFRLPLALVDGLWTIQGGDPSSEQVGVSECD